MMLEYMKIYVPLIRFFLCQSSQVKHAQNELSLNYKQLYLVKIRQMLPVKCLSKLEEM